jgi:hypothetical protein
MNAATNPFADMADDLDFSAPVEAVRSMADIAQPRFATMKAAPTEYSQPCGKCGGSGMYYGMSRYGSRCFACNGAGHKIFKTSPEARAKAREQRVEREQRAQQANLSAFEAAQPAAFAWMTAKAPTFGFAASMLQALQKYGSLTESQLAAVQRCMDSDAQRQAERAQRQQERAAAPVIALNALHSVLQKHAKFYAGDLTLSRRRDDQLVWIKHANAEKVIGKIDNGTLTLWNRPGVDNNEVREMLNEFEGAPLQSAMKYGKLSGRCCSCGRELTNDGSIEAGIGPICAQKFF